MRAEVASTAVPQRHHCGMGWDEVGSGWYSQDEDSEVNDQRRQERVCIDDQCSRLQDSQSTRSDQI